LHGDLNGQKMCAKVNSRLEPEAHSTIKLTMDLSKVHFFDMETENRID
jgi:multiple sugar transport system ATP-binding protein